DFIPNTDFKLKHNTVEIPQGGVVRKFPTVSKATDVNNKRAISNILSQYIDGFVDVSNDPFIAQIIQNKNLIAPFMAMNRLGIPYDTVVYFMNQPIIRELNKILAYNNTGYFFDNRYLDEVK